MMLKSHCRVCRAVLCMMLFAACIAQAAMPEPDQKAGCTPPHLRGSGGQRIDGARYVLAWRPIVPLRSGEFVSLEISVCANVGQPRPSTVRIDAMHATRGSGLRNRPNVRPQGPERFIVEGVLFEPAGRWDLRFDVNSGVERESLATTVTLP